MNLAGRIGKLERAAANPRRPRCEACCSGFVLSDGAEGEGHPICPACGWPPAYKVIAAGATADAWDRI